MSTPYQNGEAAPSQESTGQSAGASPARVESAQSSVAPSSRRQAFQDVRRRLSDDDLKSPGVQKLILDELEEAEAERDLLRGYIERFHEADKRAAILEERLKPAHAVEVLFAVGVGLGGAIVGLAPFFWSVPLQGLICMTLGTLMIAGSIAARVVKR